MNYLPCPTLYATFPLRWRLDGGYQDGGETAAEIVAAMATVCGDGSKGATVTAVSARTVVMLSMSAVVAKVATAVEKIAATGCARNN